MYDTISQYLEYLELEKGLSANTIDAYRRDLYDFGSRLSGKDIQSIGRNDINSYVRILKERNLAPTSIIRKVASLFVHFASRICTVQGNLTLLYSKNLQFLLYNKKIKMLKF